MASTPISLEGLFSSFPHSTLPLANRFAMAPMTRVHSPNGKPTDENVDYYRKRAKGGLGLIITEGTYIDVPHSGNRSAVPRFAKENAAQWEAIVEAVHKEGARIVPQLWHIGAARGPAIESELNPHSPTVSPSGTGLSGEGGFLELDYPSLAGIIEAFATAAALAKEIGFDGVELHGAHGYLLDQFFWSRTNTRSDHYGGDIGQRSRFPAEVVEAVRSAVGPEFPIIFRFSQWKVGHYDAKLVTTPNELQAMLSPLVRAGVDILHCSTRRHWEPEFPDFDSTLSLAGWTKKLTELPVIAVGSVGVDTEFSSGNRTLDISVEERFEILGRQFDAGEFDLVALGRSVLTDPEWVNKIRSGNLTAIDRYCRTPG